MRGPLPCHRSTKDPLAAQFRDTYGITLLKLPNNNVRLGDVYVQDKNGIANGGGLAYFMANPLTLPAPRTSGLPKVVRTFSSKLDVGTGLEILGPFMQGMGLPVAADVTGAFERAKARKMSFCLNVGELEEIMGGELGAALDANTLRSGNALMREGNKYFVVTGLVRSNSLTIDTYDAASVKTNASAEVEKLFKADAKVKVSRTDEGSLLIEGAPIIFGLRFHQVGHEKKTGKLFLGAATPGTPRFARRAGVMYEAMEVDIRDPMEPVLLPSDDESLLIDLPT